MAAMLKIALGPEYLPLSGSTVQICSCYFG
jgi:hypothetical protein